MKVLIVDDEKKICMLIHSLIAWENLGLESIGMAYDGASAYEIIERVRPHIVITDLKMPECDGIELIEKTIESRLDVRFIIISGYQDFEYAKSAIKYGVKDYLTKPIQKEDLESTLVKLKTEFEESRKQQERLMNLENTVYQSGTKLRTSLIRDIKSKEHKFFCKDLGLAG
ncbi:MAG: response regulator [Lachnospiraceae bacterium]